MEEDKVFSHYCDDPNNKLFMAFSLKDLSTRAYDVPYPTVFLFDTAQIKNHIYFTGGGLPGNENEPDQFFPIAVRVSIQSSLEATVKLLANMKVARATHTLVALNAEALFVVGGQNGTGELASCEKYSIAANEWQPCASLTEEKKWVSVCPFSGRYLYAFGGSLKTGGETEAIESLDCNAAGLKQWTRIVLAHGKELWKSSIFMGTIQLDPASILVFGGLVAKEDVRTVFLFTPATQSLVPSNPLQKEDSFYRTKPQRRGNQLMVVGAPAGDLHILELTTRIWKVIDKDEWNFEEPVKMKSASV
jgi:hypothetical protein